MTTIIAATTRIFVLVALLRFLAIGLFCITIVIWGPVLIVLEIVSAAVNEDQRKRVTALGVERTYKSPLDRWNEMWDRWHKQAKAKGFFDPGRWSTETCARVGFGAIAVIALAVALAVSFLHHSNGLPTTIFSALTSTGCDQPTSVLPGHRNHHSLPG